MALAANQWGDRAPDPSYCISYPDCMSFLSSILKSNAIQMAALMVIQRFPPYEPEPIPASHLFGARGFFGPSVLVSSDPAHNVKFELATQLTIVPQINVDVQTVTTDNYPGAGLMNVAQFKAQWDATTDGSPERVALIERTFPGIDGAKYQENLASWKAGQPAYNPNPGGGAI